MVAGMQRPFVYKGFPGVVDTARQEVVAYGGYTCCSTFYSDTWVLKNAKWSKLSPANSPGKRAFHAIAYDAARGRAVLFGGQRPTAGIAEEDLADTWEWDGVNWTQLQPTDSPSARAGHAMAYDPSRKRVVLFGGFSNTTGELNDAWEWDGVTWQRAPHTPGPQGRVEHAMAYDPIRKRLVLFGGRNREPNDWRIKGPLT